MKIFLFLFCNIFLILNSCQKIDNSYTQSINSRIDPIDISVSYNLHQDTLFLKLRFANNQSKRVFFINNLWTFEFESDSMVVTSPDDKNYRFNRIYLFQDSIKYFIKDVIDTEMSKYSFNDIYKIESNKNLYLNFSLKLDSIKVEKILEEGFKYRASFVFSKKDWEKSNNEMIIKTELLELNDVFNSYSYSYSNSNNKVNYLEQSDVFLISKSGHLKKTDQETTK